MEPFFPSRPSEVLLFGRNDAPVCSLSARRLDFPRKPSWQRSCTRAHPLTGGRADRLLSQELWMTLRSRKWRRLLTLTGLLVVTTGMTAAPVRKTLAPYISDSLGSWSLAKVQ